MELIKYRKDILIDVIAFNVDDEDDLAQLECTSMVTSGKFFNAKTAADLAKSLNNSINRVKEVEAKIIENWLYYWFNNKLTFNNTFQFY